MNVQASSERADTTPTSAARHPLVFISHDSRDADLAEAFDNLLSNTSAGMLEAFRSSDRRGTAGIEFGGEWKSRIPSHIGFSGDPSRYGVAVRAS